MWRRERKNLESKLKAWMNESLTSVVMDWWLAHRLMAMYYAGNVANWHVLGSVKPTHSQSAVAHESVTHVACRLHGGHPSPLAGCGTFSCFFFSDLRHFGIRSSDQRERFLFPWSGKEDRFGKLAGPTRALLASTPFRPVTYCILAFKNIIKYNAS